VADRTSMPAIATTLTPQPASRAARSARVALLLALLTAACHRGDVWSEGASCDRERPCRSRLTCVHGACRQIEPEPGQRCLASTPFGEPVRLPGVANHPGLSPDERFIYFGATRERDGYYDILTAARASPAEAFAAPAPVLSEAHPFDLYDPSVTADGLTLFMEGSAINFEIYTATRAAVGARFDAVQLLEGLAPAGAASNAGQGSPCVLPSGDVLYFHTELPDRSLEVVRSVRGGDGRFTPAVPLGGSINTPAWDGTPAVTPDELTLFFSSSREDGSAKGRLDIWLATRSSADAPFDAPVNVAELNTPMNEVPSWISPDACRLYFQRDEGLQAIYVAERQVVAP
jgi:hypothetical protein